MKTGRAPAQAQRAGGRGKTVAHRRKAARSAPSEPSLSAAQWRELKRRIRDADDPIRYMLVSEFSRKFMLYYDISSDVFVMNAPDKATLFKRKAVADRVKELLSPGIHVVKFTTAGGKLKRLSPFRGLRFRRAQPNSSSNGRK